MNRGARASCRSNRLRQGTGPWVLTLLVLEVSVGCVTGVESLTNWDGARISELKGADDPNSECVEQLESLVKTGRGQGKPHKGR